MLVLLNLSISHILVYYIDKHFQSACVCVSSLTVCYLKLGLGHDAACYSEGLADIIPCIRALHR